MSPSFTLRRRAGGLLLHPTSLPGPHGIGDLGPAARAFAGFLGDAGQTWWQMLPVGPAGHGNSPYMSPSAFAGNPLLISLEDLARDGLLEKKDLTPDSDLDAKRVRYDAVERFKLPRLRRAFEAFHKAPPEEFRRFRGKEAAWLDDYALFAAIKEAHGGAAWTEWPAGARKEAERLRIEIDYHAFLQFAFSRQWESLRRHAAGVGVGLIGDVPIFVAPDSADVWSRPDLFHLDPSGRPLLVAGVPPDYFSRTGQLWGNPVYDWEAHRKTGFAWWTDRLRATFARFDATRLDHFIGFLRCWAVPAGSPTAEKGSWMTGPGEDFFAQTLPRTDSGELIAEDLGVVTPEVKTLRDRFDIPGMRVLQFAFGRDPEALQYQPHHFPQRCVVYTGTHDNDTIVGWFRDAGSSASTRSARDIEEERAFVLKYVASDGREIHRDLIRLACESRADTAIVPLQDLLGLGSEARMNMPGTAEGNWAWRLDDAARLDAPGKWLLALTRDSGRRPRPLSVANPPAFRENAGA